MPTPSPFPLTGQQYTLPAHFGMIMGNLATLLMHRGGRGHYVLPLLMNVVDRLQRAVKRFERLVARIEAGHLPTAVLPAVAGARAPRPAPPPPHPTMAWRALRLPGSYGWLIRMIPHKVAGYGAQLEHLLGDPAMAALLAMSPGARRMLRPICRLLMIPIGPALAAPKRVARKPAVESPAVVADAPPAESSPDAARPLVASAAPAIVPLPDLSSIDPPARGPPSKMG